MNTLLNNLKKLPTNVYSDTRKADLMVKGIKYGVDLINDVSGFEHDKESLIKLKNYKIAKVLII